MSPVQYLRSESKNGVVVIKSNTPYLFSLPECSSAYIFVAPMEQIRRGGGKKKKKKKLA